MNVQYLRGIILIYCALQATSQIIESDEENALAVAEPTMSTLQAELRNLSQRLDAVNYRITIDSWFTALLTSDLQGRMDNLSAELGLDDALDGLKMRLKHPDNVELSKSVSNDALQNLEQRLGMLEANELQTALDQHVKLLSDRIDAQNRLLAGFLPNIDPDEVEQKLIELTAHLDELELASTTNNVKDRLDLLSERLDALMSDRDELASQAALNELTLQLAHLSIMINALDPPPTVADEPLALSDNDMDNAQPANCRQALGESGQSGIYEILVPSYNVTPFPVYCDAQHGGGWTVIQRRSGNKVNFNRNWAEYKRGFGYLNGSYFIGLDKLHALTALKQKQELFIILTDFENVTKTAHYSEFAIGDEKTSYPLKRLGSFVGSGGLPDSLRAHVGMKFSTKDRDNDINNTGRSCALRYLGAWWFNNCVSSHLNGKLLPPNEGQGILWRGFHIGNKARNLKFAQMMIRPRIH